MGLPAKLAAVGIALEPSYGTTTAPVLQLPYSKLAPVDNNALVFDQSWRGSAVDVVSHETGTLDSQIAIGGPVQADSIGFFLAGLLGDVAFAAGSPNTFTMALKNSGTQQPPSYTVSVNDQAGLEQWAGCKVSDLSMSFSADALLTYQARLAGLASTVPGSLTMPAVGSEKVLQGWLGALKIGGSSEARLLSATLSFSRPVTAKRNATGAQAPVLQRSEALSVSGQFDVAVLTDSYRAGFLAGTATSFDLNYQTGAGASLRQLLIHCSQIGYTSAPRSYGARWVELTASFTAEGNTTDVGASGGRSPVKVTLKNAIGSGVYA